MVKIDLDKLIVKYKNKSKNVKSIIGLFFHYLLDTFG